MTTAYRRPIAARESGIIQRFAAWPVATCASADAIALAGMAAGLAAGAGFAATPLARRSGPSGFADRATNNAAAGELVGRLFALFGRALA